MSKPREIREWFVGKDISRDYVGLGIPGQTFAIGVERRQAAELAFYSRVTVRLKKLLSETETLMQNTDDGEYADIRLVHALRGILERAEKET